MTLKTKECRKCETTKPISEFCENKRYKDKYDSWCKSCHREYNKKWYKANSEKVLKQTRMWAKNNPNKMRELQKNWCKNNPQKASARTIRWRKKNPDKVKAMAKNRYKKRRANILHKLSDRIRGGMNKSLYRSKEGYHWEDVVGYTVVELKKHLERQFQTGMTWDNYGDWQIDHIIPISLWEFKTYKDREFKQCWALCNLQPLWAEDNKKKSNKTGGRIRGKRLDWYMETLDEAYSFGVQELQVGIVKS